MRLAIVGVLLVLTASPASACEILGIKNGMTPAQVQQVAPAGYVLREGGVPNTAALVKGDHIFAIVAFCDCYAVSVSQSLDPDVDWLPILKDNLRERGQLTVRTRSQALPSAAGGYIEQVESAGRVEGRGTRLRFGQRAGMVGAHSVTIAGRPFSCIKFGSRVCL